MLNTELNNSCNNDFQDELGLNRELMFKLPLEKRWELYLSKQKVYIYTAVILLGRFSCHMTYIATQQFPGNSLTQRISMLTSVMVDW